MRKFFEFALVAGLTALVIEPIAAQSNNDDYTPLNSRIKRKRQFPLDLPNRFNRMQMTEVMRERSKDMMSQFTACLYRRSNQQALRLLEQTDMGFTSFQQIGLDTNRALRIYGFNDCLGRVASIHSSSVQLRFTAGALRQWMLQQAYLDTYPDGATWLKLGNVIADRTFPLSEDVASVHATLDFVDCVVEADPYGADFFFRATPGSAEEREAINGLMPVLGPCLPDNLRMELDPATLRTWLGEALWHAARNSAPGVEG